MSFSNDSPINHQLFKDGSHNILIIMAMLRCDPWKPIKCKTWNKLYFHHGYDRSTRLSYRAVSNLICIVQYISVLYTAKWHTIFIFCFILQGINGKKHLSFLKYIKWRAEYCFVLTKNVKLLDSMLFEWKKKTF